MNKYEKKPFYLSNEDIKWVENRYNEMSLEEKIGQLFCLVVYGYDENYFSYIINNLKIGSLMFRPMPKNELIKSVSYLQNNSKLPLLISANIESGGCGIIEGGTKLQSPLGIAATNDSDYAGILGEVCGLEGAACGVNWDFAPIVDIDKNFRNPITNTRTFGSDEYRVAIFSSKFINKLQNQGVAACAKHFPGDGVDERDQHLVTSVNDLSCEEWDDSYGKVFDECIDHGVKSIMVGHISLPNYSKKLNPNLLDEDILPASLSYEITTTLLKDKLGFNGLVVTDATAMAGMNIALPRNLLVPTAIAAGSDIFLFTKNMDEDFRYMREGIENGTITKERLKDAVMNVLAFKASLSLHKKKKDELCPNEKNINKIVACQKHKDYEKLCADKSITIIKEEAGILPISTNKYKSVLVYDISGGANSVGYGADACACDRFIKKLNDKGYFVEKFTPYRGMEGLMVSYEEFTKKYDLIIYIANLATKSNQTVVRIEWSNPMGANVPIYMNRVPTVFISLENPYHLLDVPRVKTYINTYSSSDIVLDSLIQKLEGKSKFCGMSPVDAFCGKWDTKL